MPEEQRLIEMRGVLQSFLSDFEDYAGEVFDEHRQALLDELRGKLQLKEPRITAILEEGFSGKVFGLGYSGSVSISDLVPSALMGGNNELPHNFHAYNTIVTSLLRRALGKIEDGLWPQQETKPILIINDSVLRDRCFDLLEAPGNYDRVVREATIVLEDRIWRKPPHEVLSRLIPNSSDQSGRTLINKLFQPDSPILSISSDRAERVKFREILIGVISYLRNPYHHHLDDSTEWSWAWSTVGFIDALLNEVDNCTVTES